MRFLPEISDTGKYYIERDFLFAIVNTIDRNYFREALAEIEVRRAKRAMQGDEGLIEIDKNLFGLLEQVQSRMSANKIVAIKRTIHSLTGLMKPRN